MTASVNGFRKPYYWINALEKGLALLEFLADREGLSVTDISRALSMDRSTCNRFLLTLKDLGYVGTDTNGKYRAALKLFEIGSRISAMADIRTQAHAYMEKIARHFKETVNLGRLDGGDVVTIDLVNSPETIRFDAPIGSRSPIYTLAMGKAILAFRAEEERRRYLESCPFEPLTPNTITSKKALERELARVRTRGYALDNREWAMDTRCVAVPIFDHSAFPSHAISVSGPAVRLTEARVKTMVPELKAAGNALSRELGYRPYRDGG